MRQGKKQSVLIELWIKKEQKNEEKMKLLIICITSGVQFAFQFKTQFSLGVFYNMCIMLLFAKCFIVRTISAVYIVSVTQWFFLLRLILLWLYLLYLYLPENHAENCFHSNGDKRSLGLLVPTDAHYLHILLCSNRERFCSYRHWNRKMFYLIHHVTLLRKDVVSSSVLRW